MDAAGRHADNDRRAVSPHQAQALLDRPFDADGDEHIVGLAASCYVRHAGGDILAARLTAWVAPKSRAASSLASDIDRDDRRAAGEPGALHAVEADAAAADDDDRGACFDGGGIDDGAHAGQHAAGDQRRALQRHVLADGDRLRRLDHHMFGEGAGAQPMDDRLAALRGQRALPVQRKNRLAEHRRAPAQERQRPQERTSVTTA